MEATGRTGTQSPFFFGAESIPYLASSVTQSVVCISLGHRMLQSNEQSVQLAKKLQSHRGKAIRHLIDELASYRHETADVTLISLFIFLLAEVQLTRLASSALR
jgi:hypothetical protein